MDLKEKIAEAKKKEEEENKINKKIISNAIIELFSNFKYMHGSIEKTKKKGYLELFVDTGFWSENEKVVKKFNNTKFNGATMKWWCISQEGDSYYMWDIPLYLVDDDIINAKI